MFFRVWFLLIGVVLFGTTPSFSQYTNEELRLIDSLEQYGALYDDMVVPTGVTSRILEARCYHGLNGLYVVITMDTYAEYLFCEVPFSNWYHFTEDSEYLEKNYEDDYYVYISPYKCP